MRIRTITAIILIGIFVPLIYISGLPLLITLGVLAAMGTFELTRVYSSKVSKESYYKSVLILNIITSVLLYSFVVAFTVDGFGIFNFIVYFKYVAFLPLVLMVIYLFYFTKKYNIRDNYFRNMIISVVYPTLGFASLMYIRGNVFDAIISNDAELYLQYNFNIAYIFMVPLCTDTFAYFSGYFFGKHKLAPKISPKKTIEGSIGGTFMTVLCVFLFVWIFDVEMIGDIPTTWYYLITVTVLLSILAQIGDLLMSYIKRQYNVKDFANLFPGHGGIMDRFDSVVFVALWFVLISKLVTLL